MATAKAWPSSTVISLTLSALGLAVVVIGGWIKFYSATQAADELLRQGLATVVENANRETARVNSELARIDRANDAQATQIAGIALNTTAIAVLNEKVDNVVINQDRTYAVVVDIQRLLRSQSASNIAPAALTAPDIAEILQR